MKNKVIILSLFTVSVIIASCNSTKPVIVGENEDNTEAKKHETEREKVEKEVIMRQPVKQSVMKPQQIKIQEVK